MSRDPDRSHPSPQVGASWGLITIVVWNVAGLVIGSAWLVYYFAWWGLGLPEQPAVSRWLTFWGYVLSGSDWWIGVGIGYAILMVSFVTVHDPG